MQIVTGIKVNSEAYFPKLEEYQRMERELI